MYMQDCHLTSFFDLDLHATQPLCVSDIVNSLRSSSKYVIFECIACK